MAKYNVGDPKCFDLALSRIPKYIKSFNDELVCGDGGVVRKYEIGTVCDTDANSDGVAVGNKKTIWFYKTLKHAQEFRKIDGKSRWCEVEPLGMVVDKVTLSGTVVLGTNRLRIVRELSADELRAMCIAEGIPIPEALRQPPKGDIKVGTLVKIREDLIPGNHYGGVRFALSMKEYCGQTAAITECHSSYYRLDSIWQVWSREMFESIEPAPFCKVDTDALKWAIDVIEDTYYYEDSEKEIAHLERVKKVLKTIEEMA